MDKIPQVATPANWTVRNNFKFLNALKHINFYFQPGEKVMILPTVKDEEAEKLFKGQIERISMPSGIGYVRTTTNYKI